MWSLIPGRVTAALQIVLLCEGTGTSQGRGQILSNINAWCADPPCTRLSLGAETVADTARRSMAVVDIVQSTLGPRGMDKMIYDDSGKAQMASPPSAECLGR